MPIKPERRWLYPIDWRELSAAVRLGRAGGCCEACRRPHLAWICQAADGSWYDPDRGCWRDRRGRKLRRRGGAALPLPYPHKVTRVVLACAHLDHDPANNAAGNLMALCQGCHLAHDRAEHRRRRWSTWRASKALGDLFAGPYTTWPRPLVS